MSEYTGERFIPVECVGEMAIEHYQRYQFAKEFVKGKKVLDAACGEGYGSSLLAEEASHVTGIDIDEKTVESANQKYGNEHVFFRVGSVGELPFKENSFDVIISFETIEHVSEDVQRSFLKEIRRVLREDGLLIISTPNKRIYTDRVEGKNIFHTKEFYPQEFLRFLKEEFSELDVFCQYPDLGYFLTRENEPVEMLRKRGKSQDESRYLVVVCSSKSQSYQVNTTGLTMFDDTMYYDLNLAVHREENTIIQTKAEAETFASQQEKSISDQKRYIKAKEKDILEMKSYIEKQEKDILEMKSYVEQKEKDILKMRFYIEKLEKDVGTQTAYVEELGEDARKQREYIERLEGENQSLKNSCDEYRSMLKHPMKTLWARMIKKK